MKIDQRRIAEIDTIEDFNDKMLEAAVYYAESGFYVIPIRPNEKAIPPKSTGLSYHHASKNPKTVAKWYAGKYQGWNIGLCCGAEDGIFVLDIDTGNKDGFKSIKKLTSEHGELHTLKQKTPRGGEHYIYKWFGSGRSSTSKIGEGIDTRGGDGQNKSHIVTWPSIVKGKPYVWDTFEDIEEAPEWIGTTLGEPWSTNPRAGGRGNENVDDESVETQFGRGEVWTMLEKIDPDSLEYEDWLQIGQAVHSQHPDEYGLELWNAWSERGQRYEVGECAKRWSGFKPDGPVRVGTLIHHAQKGGYVVKANITQVDFEGEQNKYQELIDEMNKEWGLAVVGGKVRIVGRILNSDPEQDLQLITVDDFKTMTMNQRISVQTATGAKAMPKSNIWLADEGRKQYWGGVHFRPDMPTEYEETPGLLSYNMWRGWKKEPAPGDWSKLKEHIFKIVCSGNHAHNEWLLDWMADLFQDPMNPKGCAVVLHGIEGCGKGTFMEAMGRTMGRHYKHLTQEAHLTGNFNGHLQDALLIFADEVIYGGSRKTGGTLKAMVTEKKLTVERKGIDAYSFRNCARIGIASNEDWFIPAGPQSRRWFVLEVSKKKAQDPTWFDEIYKEMDNGGIEAMIYELLQRRILSNLSTAPVTDALIDQRGKSADSRQTSVQAWIYDVVELTDLGCICYNTSDMESNEWPQLVSRPELYDSYKNWVATSGRKMEPISKAVFYNEMLRYGFINVRPSSPEVIKRSGGTRSRMFEVPPIETIENVINAQSGINESKL